MNWVQIAKLVFAAVGAMGLFFMLPAFALIARQGWKATIQQPSAEGRWPMPRRLLLIGASLGAIFEVGLTALNLTDLLLQPPGLREVRRFAGHHSTVSRVAISADGQRLLSTSSGYIEVLPGDDSVRVWDAATGQELRRLEGSADEQVHSLAISAEGRRALTGGRTIRLWDLESGQVLKEMQGNAADVAVTHEAWSIAFSPDYQQALSSGADSVRQWDLATGAESRFPDGQQALSGGWDGTVRLWDLATGQEVRSLKTAAQQVISVAFSLDGHLAAAGSGSGWVNQQGKNTDGNFVQVWDLATGQELHRLKTDHETATCLAFSPDGNRLLAASRYGFSTRLWDLNSGHELHHFNGQWYAHAVAFAADGRQALCLDSNPHMGLWDVLLGKEIARATTRQGSEQQPGQQCAAFARDARYAASGDNNKVMWLWALPD